MKIAPRIALATSAVVAISLGGYGVLSLRTRRVELEGDLERQTLDLALAVAAAVEAEAQLGRAGDPLDRAQQLAARQTGATLIVSKLDDYVDTRASPDALERTRHVQIQGQAVREYVPARNGDPPYLALAFPVRREGVVVGVLELRRDAAVVDREMSSATWRIGGTIATLVVFLGLAVWLIARAAVTRPLERMLQEMRLVGQGDLSRVAFAERNDEAGQLAARFNEMTSSLREAREEMRRGAVAKDALEQRLRMSEKLATIGQLAAEIAHEVGTPLAVIGGRARSLEKKAGDAGEVARNADIIAAQATRISKIIERLLDFARRRSPPYAELDLDRVVAEAVEFLELQMERSRVTLEHESSALPATVLGDADAIQQVCLNLLVNAIQAMPKGGRLRVSTRVVTRRKGELEAAAPAAYACLEVSDTGVGVAPEVRDKMFEPFYSTKDGGTGLGLAVSHGIIKDHDGWIEVVRRPEGGTTFLVFLPAAGAESEAAEARG
jgi:signal transduction histidine kinase